MYGNFETGSIEEIGKRKVANPNPVNRVWFDDIVIATEYIGPIRTAVDLPFLRDGVLPGLVANQPFAF